MTRRYVDAASAAGRVRVTLGYDRALDEFFLNVELLAAGHLPEFIYTSNEDPERDPKSLEPYARKLEGLGVKVPPSLFPAVAEDALRRRGNWIVEHLADGAVRTILQEPDS
jgi:hypothetical protein